MQLLGRPHRRHASAAIAKCCRTWTFAITFGAASLILDELLRMKRVRVTT